MARKQKNLYFWLAAGSVFVAATLYCSWPLGFLLNPVASRSGLASELGAFGQPYNWVFIWGDVISGILLVIGSVLLQEVIGATRWMKACLMLLAVYGLCAAVDASLPLRCLPSVQHCGPVFDDPVLVLHGVFDYLGNIALFGTLLIAWKLARQQSSYWLVWVYMMGLAGIFFAILSVLLFVDHGPGYWAQRYFISISCIWVASLPFVLHYKLRYTRST